MSLITRDSLTDLETALARPSWMDEAICRGHTQLFFAPHAERPPARLRREAAARQVCMRCPVRLECRDHARENLEYGLWGGESEGERADAGYVVAAPIGGRIAHAV
ncbi:WhiB family transcriptional regulator [Iamia sp.]|uniref:WhiB family transcriptional regulator n=1 Tax=Iamia sp. TaxID=2722710 RepID=UPI002C53F8D7|nr:WhiB family transcriptional regulator [Iamia sp.]HXH56041.1 WhiB family transcriptional regulator [Iamia sp.]